MRELNYNIHNLLTMKIRGHGSIDPTGDLRYSHFVTSECPDNPDIILNIGPFTPLLEGTETIAHKYYVRDNYFYCREKASTSKWEIEIQGFEKGNTVINFSGRYAGIRGWVFPTFMAQEFLIPIIEYKLARKNHFLLHGGAVCKDNAGYVFTGRPGVWKTSLLLDLMRTNEYTFLGDDRIIVSEEKDVLSFPTSLFLFNYTLKNSRTEQRNTLDNIRLLFQGLMHKTENNSLNPIAKSCVMKKMIFISRKNNQNIHIASILPQEGLQKILTNNLAESVESTKKSPVGQYFIYTQIYSLIFPDNDLVKHYDRMNDGLQKIVMESPVVEITLPFSYDQTALDAVKKQIVG